MNKKTSLTEALSERTQELDKVTTDPGPKEPGGTKRAGTPVRPDRQDKTNITGYFDKPVKWELQDLATERSRTLGRRVTVQELLGEALNDLLKKYGKPEIVSTGRE